MSLEDVIKGATIPAVLAGIGLAALAPMLLRGVGNGGRPLAKSLLHKYLDMADKFKELGAETQEQWRDLLAEVQAEREAQQAAEATKTMAVAKTSEATTEA
jgi:hypothetical protein